RAARRRPAHHTARARRRDGPVGLRQVDAHELARLSRRADLRCLSPRRRGRRSPLARPPRRDSQSHAGLRLPELLAPAAHDRARLTSRRGARVMNLLRTFAVAFAALGRTKVRSFLTVLGVIIGVGAVIAMVSVGEGAKKRVAAQFEAMGTSTLIVSGGSFSSG